MLNTPVSAGPRDAVPDTRVALSQPMTHITSLDLPEPMFLSVREISVLLGIARATVYRLANRGILPAHRFLSKVVFRKKDVAAWIESTKEREPGTPV